MGSMQTKGSPATLELLAGVELHNARRKRKEEDKMSRSRSSVTQMGSVKTKHSWLTALTGHKGNAPQTARV